MEHHHIDQSGEAIGTGLSILSYWILHIFTDEFIKDESILVFNTILTGSLGFIVVRVWKYFFPEKK